MLLLVGMTVSFVCLADDDQFDKNKSLNLPDFTRTYGFDANPDVRLMKKPPANATDKQKLKSFRNSLKNRFQKKRKDGTKYGVHSYTKYTGTKRYGVGMRKNIGKHSKHGIIVHDHGVNYERQRKRTKYYMGVDTRSPVEKKTNEESTYMFLGIKVHW